MSNGLNNSNKYRVEKEIETDSSIILKAYDNELKMYVAIKALNSKLLGIEDAESRFLEEIQLLARIHSDNVLRVLHFYDKGAIGDRSYLVMEWMDATLEEVIASKKSLTPPQALQLLKKIAVGLSAIHEQGIVHHDLTPENITVSSDLSSVKIGDLGFAAEVGEEKTHPFTPKYTAPENYHTERSVNQQSDIYSLGVIAYELFLGRELFRKTFDEIYSERNEQVRKSRWQHWHMNQGKKAKSLSEVAAEIHPEVAAIVDRMLAKDTSERYFEVKDILSDLNAIDPSNMSYIKPISLEDYVDDEDRKTFVQRLLQPKIIGLVLLVCASLSVSTYFIMDYLAREKLKDTVVAAFEQAKGLRQQAEAGGADASIDTFARAEQSYESGKILYEQGSLEDSLASFIAAGKAYQAAASEIPDTDPVQLASLEENRVAIAAYLDYINPENHDELLAQLDSRYGEWSENLTATNSAAIHEAESAWIAELDERLATLPRIYQVGSTPEEIDAALATCDEAGLDCSKSWYETEALRDVTLRPYILDQSEVSYSQFEEFAAATGYTTTAERLGYSYIYDGEKAVQTKGLSWRSPNATEYDQATLPAMSMSAADAEEYCQWRSARLPTDEEWEYASRGPERMVYSWGNDWTSDRLSGTPLPVGSNADQAFFAGLNDMTGNVWEWVRTGTGYGLKGGSFLETNAANFRSAARRDAITDVVNVDDGFRCAADADKWPAHRGDDTLQLLRAATSS